MRKKLSRFALAALGLPVSFMFLSCDLLGMFVPPDTPTNLAVFQVSDTAVQLAWIATSTNERSFEVERRTDPDQPFVLIGSANAGDSRYTNTNLLSDTKYYFRIRAKNSAGFSEYASEVNVTTLTTGQTAITPELRIVSPVDGATVSSPFNLSFSVSDWQREAGRDTHLHPFYDGVNQGAVFDLAPLSIDLDPGVHVITLKLANSDHTFIGVDATVEVTVSP